MVAPTRIIAGLGMSLGIHRLEVPTATGSYLKLAVHCMQLCTAAWARCPALACGRLHCPLALATLGSRVARKSDK